jgi:hypothetical protein
MAALQFLEHGDAQDRDALQLGAQIAELAIAVGHNSLLILQACAGRPQARPYRLEPRPARI